MQPIWPRSTKVLGCIAALGCLLPAGCQHLTNPFSDDIPDASMVTTMSMEIARAAPMKPNIRRREFAEMRIEPQYGTVQHWPNYYEDPFEDKGSEDEMIAWTWEDYLATFYGPGRFILNTMGLPVSLAVTPPFTVMCSDGKLSQQALGYDHDATPCPAGVAPPIDYLEIGTYGPADQFQTHDTPAHSESSDIPVVPVEN
jgi:hypothetical protein